MLDMTEIFENAKKDSLRCVMITFNRNVKKAEAEALFDQIREMPGVESVGFYHRAVLPGSEGYDDPGLEKIYGVGFAPVFEEAVVTAESPERTEEIARKLRMIGVSTGAIMSVFAPRN